MDTKTSFLELMVRLRGSEYPHEGRVEVYYDGQWGTVCDDHWGFREATVICRMLNYSSAVYAVRYAYFGAGNSSYPIWLDNVKCRGDEHTIAACTHQGWNDHNCGHYEDAGVICFNGSAPQTESKAKEFNQSKTAILYLLAYKRHVRHILSSEKRFGWLQLINFFNQSRT